MSEELKPCPFCGGEAVFQDIHYDGDPHWWFEVNCDGCGISHGAVRSDYEDDHSDAHNQLALSWNTRAYEQAFETDISAKNSLELNKLSRDDLYNECVSVSIRNTYLVNSFIAQKKQMETLTRRIAALANFNPDWDMLEATQESLREHMQICKSLKQQLSVALEALKIGYDCAVELTDFDEIPLADRQYSGIAVIARAIQQVEGNEPYPLQHFDYRWSAMNGVSAGKVIVGMNQMWSDGSWRELEVAE